MDSNKAGQLIFSLNASADAQRFEEAIRSAAEQLAKFRADVMRERRELWRGEWWKRGEPSSQWIAEVGEPEWWQDGDEPPALGIAA